VLNIRAIADQITVAADLPPVPERLEYSKLDKNRARLIAVAYEGLPKHDTNAMPAYEKLAEEIENQFDMCVAAGIQFDAYGDDDGPAPYANSTAMMADVLNNRHLWVYDGGEDHPGLTREQNWKFRAVHDVFGHAWHGYQFGPRGEENAWRCHMLMFGWKARQAMSTETRGQNSWVNFGPCSDKPVTERPFAAQKLALLPKWAMEV
jgi:hypothetical protein